MGYSPYNLLLPDVSLMPQIHHLAKLLTRYHTLPHHDEPTLAHALSQVQTWQKQRIRTTHHELFRASSTAALAEYLINRIYDNDDFKPLATQLLTAANNALSGSNKLQKLIPTHALDAGLLGVQAAITAIELDLQLAHALLADGAYAKVPDDETMYALYRTANTQDARTAQIYTIGQTCERSYKYFSSFILQHTFKLAKGVAYDNDYQLLYDFIADGLVAMKPIKDIRDFTLPFTQGELNTIACIYGDHI